MKNKLFTTIAMTAVILSFTGSAFAMHACPLVKPGMTVQQLINRAGKPTHIYQLSGFSGKNKADMALEYCRSNKNEIARFAKRHGGKVINVNDGQIAVEYNGRGKTYLPDKTGIYEPVKSGVVSGQVKLFLPETCRVYFFRDNKLTGF